MESFAKGDQVALREPLGELPAGELGIVMEVYRENETPDGAIIGTKDFETYGPQTLFDYGVAFTRLGRRDREHNGEWITDKIDLSQFDFVIGDKRIPNGNIIPLAHHELDFINSTLRGLI